MSGSMDLMEPECPTCGRPMMLSRIEPLVDQIGLERRTFECRWCPHTESYAVELEQKRSLLDPFHTNRRPS
jgi:hypothetical protein